MISLHSTRVIQRNVSSKSFQAGAILLRNSSTTPRIESYIEEYPSTNKNGGRVARITINNTKKANSLTLSLLHDLKETVRKVDQDPDLRAIILQGAGKNFSGGVNISEMAKFSDPKSAESFITLLHETCDVFQRVSVPTIASIQGACYGGALEMVASCDMRIATKNSRFCMPEVAIGLPSVIEAARLPQLIGWGRTRRFLYTAETIDSATALQWGLIEELVEDGEDHLDKSVRNIASKIVDAGPRAIRIQKDLFNQWESMHVNDAVKSGIRGFARAFETDEPRSMLNEKLKLLERNNNHS